MEKQLDLFETVTIEPKKKEQPRVPTGQWVEKRVAQAYNSKIESLRLCIISTIRQHESVANQLRQKEEIIIKLRNEIKQLRNSL